jgi:NADH-quinone oxidoreductase subunit N
MLILTSVLLVFKHSVFKDRAIANSYIVYAGLIAAFLFLFAGISYPPNRLFNSLAVSDPLSLLAKIICLLPLLMFTVLKDKADNGIQEGRYIFGFLITAASMIAVSSANFLLLIVSFALIDVCMFFLLAIPARQKKETANIWSYALAGLISWILIITGAAILFGLSGSMDYYTINSYISVNAINQNALLMSLLLILAGISFKLFIFPFDIVIRKILPDISWANLSYLLVTLPVAGVFITARILLSCFANGSPLNANPLQLSMLPGFYWNGIIITASSLMMLWAVIRLFRAKDLRNVLLYLVLIQTSVFMTGIGAVSNAAFESAIAMLIAVVIPVFTLIYLLRLFESEYGIKTIDGLRGFGKQNLLVTISFAVCILSLAGFPLTIGFPAKINLLNSVFHSIPVWSSLMIIVTMIAVCVQMFRLLLILFQPNTDAGEEVSAPANSRNRPALFVVLFFIVLGSVYFEPLIWIARYFSKIYGI